MWADENGSPHSDALHVVERWTRPDADHFHVETLIEDPKFYTRPFTYSRTWIARQAGRRGSRVLVQREQRRPRSLGLRSGPDPQGRHSRLRESRAAAAAASRARKNNPRRSST